MSASNAHSEPTRVLPATKPERVADLDAIVQAQGHHRHTAHIPDPESEESAPLCALGDTYQGATWRTKPPTVFSADPDAWLSLCEHCLAAYDRMNDETGGERA